MKVFDSLIGIALVAGMCFGAPTGVAGTGRDAGNGGNVVVSPTGQVRFLDVVKRPTCTRFEPDRDLSETKLSLVLEMHSGFRLPLQWPGDGMVDRAAVSLSVKERILRALHDLEFLRTSRPLPKVDDRGVVILKWSFRDGKIRQLAIQDPKSKKVMVQGALYDDLSADDRAAFFMHEALIRVYYDHPENPDLKDTEAIGNFVHETFNPDLWIGDGLNLALVTGYLRDIRIEVQPAPDGQRDSIDRQ